MAAGSGGAEERDQLAECAGVSVLNDRLRSRAVPDSIKAFLRIPCPLQALFRIANPTATSMPYRRRIIDAACSLAALTTAWVMVPVVAGTMQSPIDIVTADVVHAVSPPRGI